MCKRYWNTSKLLLDSVTKTSFFTTFMLVQDMTTWSLQSGVFASSFSCNTTMGHMTAARRPSKIVPSSVPSSRHLLVWPSFGGIATYIWPYIYRVLPFVVAYYIQRRCAAYYNCSLAFIPIQFLCLPSPFPCRRPWEATKPDFKFFGFNYALESLPYWSCEYNYKEEELLHLYGSLAETVSGNS